jgi:hypothetical protein
VAAETLEERVAQLENRLQTVEQQLANQTTGRGATKRGWRWFVGIYADSPDFDEVVRIGQEWRNADRPVSEEDEKA